MMQIKLAWGKSWRAPLLIVVSVRREVMVNDILAGDARGSSQKLIQDIDTNIPVGIYVWIIWNNINLFITMKAFIHDQFPEIALDLFCLIDFKKRAFFKENNLLI